MKNEKAKVSSAPSFKVGDMVEHLDDPAVKGKVIALKEDPKNGKVRARIEGVGNLLPADKLKLAK